MAWNLKDLDAPQQRILHYFAMNIVKDSSKHSLIDEYIKLMEKLSNEAREYRYNHTEAEYRDWYSKRKRPADEVLNQVRGKLDFMTSELILSKYNLYKKNPSKFNEVYKNLSNQVKKDYTSHRGNENADLDRYFSIEVGSKLGSKKDSSNYYIVSSIKDNNYTLVDKSGNVYNLSKKALWDRLKVGILFLKESIVIPKANLLEATRQELISKARSDTKRRYNARLPYRPVTFDGVNIKELFENDDLVFTTKVGDYTDILAVKGVLSELKSILSNKTRCTYADVLKAINNCLNKDGIRIDCNCPDFCLTGDTKISLLDGRDLDILSIVEEFNSGRELWVYSADKNGDFKPGKIIDAWKTGTSANMYKITLDNGEVIKCTGNHPFMVRDGSYVNAEDLIIGQSLMPMYKRVGSKGYEQIRLNSSQTKSDYRSTYKLVAQELFSDEIDRVSKFESRDGSTAIHHKDFNKSNNNPDNLQIMGRLEHWDYHKDLVKFRLENDPEFYKATLGKGHDYWRTEEGRAKKSEEMSQFISNWWASLTDEERQAHSKKCWDSIDKDEWRDHLSKGRKRFFDSMTQEERSEYSRKSINSPEAIRKAAVTRSATMKAKYANMSQEEKDKLLDNSLRKPRSESYKKKISIHSKRYNESLTPEQKSARSISAHKGKAVKVLKLVASENLNLTPESYDNYPYPRKPNWKKWFNSFSEFVSYAGLAEYNHKVVEIEKLEGSYDIYDITVDKWHNFTLTSGVIVSNTYRFAYVASQGGYKYGTQETRPANITNPEGRGSMCKHLASLLTNKIWIVKVAAAVNNYIRLNKEECYPYLDLEVPVSKSPKKDIPNQEPEVIDDKVDIKDTDSPAPENDQVEVNDEEVPVSNQEIATEEPEPGEEENQADRGSENA